MKFGKWLKLQIQESLPEWRDKFISYKDLKKLVTLISSSPTSQELPESTKAEADFVERLNTEIDKFNTFFVEQEEDFVIRQKELQERVQSVVAEFGSESFGESEYRKEMQKIRKDIVDFHGEMVLLENYSNVNYIGLAKILKKYDKRTGCLLRLPFIKKVLDEPFYITDLLVQLVKESESTMEMMFPDGREERNMGDRQGTKPVMAAEQSIFRNTVAALATMREMRKASSTHSPLSLPPLNLPEIDQVISLVLPSDPIAII